MEKLSWALIMLGIVLWFAKEVRSENRNTVPSSGKREKVQQIDSRMYR